MKNYKIKFKRFRKNLERGKLFHKNKIFCRIMVTTFLFVCSFSFSQTHNSEFNSLYAQIQKKNFFSAREIFTTARKKLPVEYQYFTEAILNNAFNKPRESNLKILKLEELKTITLPDSLLLKISHLKEDNSMKQYDYAGAKTAVQNTLKKYDQILTEEERSDLKNNLKIWTALEKEPRQKVTMKGSTNMKMEKDVANLKNLKVQIGDDFMNFIFDTGANISTISESAAKRLKMRIIPAGIDVDAITGISVKADLAVCEKFKLGNVIIENAVFLVFADTALSFPQIKYQINGILGFPVIEALREVQLTQDDYFIVPEAETKISSPSNMAIDGLSPLIFIDEKHYSFDTGADQTMLYAPFYQENKKEIDEHYKVSKIGMGGAGGKAEYDGFKINHTFHILGKEIELRDIRLLKDKINKETVYGNIGQDVIRKFNKMTMNFDQMFIKFD
ncbi:retropepsin-like aspartic protease [Chryseobacterium daecheongense]|nr:retropepsin-like aspartic protease [Chryseobacterium daecheongense]